MVYCIGSEILLKVLLPVHYTLYVTRGLKEKKSDMRVLILNLVVTWFERSDVYRHKTEGGRKWQFETFLSKIVYLLFCKVRDFCALFGQLV